jgi:hypothetical protein
MEVPKSETQVSTDLRDEADRIDDLAHALADHFGRTVVVVWTDDKEVVVVLLRLSVTDRPVLRPMAS